APSVRAPHASDHERKAGRFATYSAADDPSHVLHPNPARYPHASRAPSSALLLPVSSAERSAPAPFFHPHAQRSPAAWRPHPAPGTPVQSPLQPPVVPASP